MIAVPLPSAYFRGSKAESRGADGRALHHHMAMASPALLELLSRHMHPIHPCPHLIGFVFGHGAGMAMPNRPGKAAAAAPGTVKFRR